MEEQCIQLRQYYAHNGATVCCAFDEFFFKAIQDFVPWI